MQIPPNDAMAAGTGAAPWFAEFTAAAVLASILAAALGAALAARRAERRRILACLPAPGTPGIDPARAVRTAMDDASRTEGALAELRAILDAAPAGIVTLDPLGRVVSVNPAAARLLGTDRNAPIGRLLGELVRSPELDSLLASVRETGNRAETELAFASASGEHRAGCSVAPLSRAAGAADLLLVLEDRTELRRLEGLRTEFVANVSHELRTPITTIRGYAETLSESMDLPPDAARFARTISRGAARLGAIVDDLLLLSSLEDPASRNLLAAMPVRIAGIVAEAVEQCAAAAREKRVRVDTAVDPRLWVSGNAGLLAHAVGNLVSNAIKYGPEDSAVAVTAGAEEGQAVVSVIDRGPGIAEVHRARLFERFYRVDRARSRDAGGTGLGLAIVKHVAMVHGGTVEVESRTDAQHGTTFRLRLPVADLGESRTLPINATDVRAAAPARAEGRQSA